VNISRYKYAPVNVTMFASWHGKGSPDPYQFCNGPPWPDGPPGGATCSVNHPEGWAPGELDYCGEGQLSFLEEAKWSWSWTEPFGSGPPNNEPPVNHHGTEDAASGQSVGILTAPYAILETQASDGRLKLSAIQKTLAGMVCGQVENPGAWTNVMFFGWTG